MADNSEKSNYTEYYAACDWCADIVKKYDRSIAISEILIRLTTENNRWIALALKEELSRQYTMAKEYDSAKTMLEEITHLKPDSEMAFANLASHYFYALEQHQNALDTILLAEKISQQSGHFRRHILAQKARIALGMNDYELLGKTLEAISEVNLQKNQRDVGVESDFFDQADLKRLAPEIVQKYKNYLSSKKHG